MMNFASVIFEEKPEREDKKGYKKEAARIKHVLEVRIGIILLGDIFSGKTTTMNLFSESYEDYKVESIHINALSVQ